MICHRICDQDHLAVTCTTHGPHFGPPCSTFLLTAFCRDSRLDVGCWMFDVRVQSCPSLSSTHQPCVIFTHSPRCRLGVEPALVAFENMAAGGGLSPRMLQSLG